MDGCAPASARSHDSASTELRPAHTHLEADAADLPAGEFTEVRVELFPFAHPFRAGSRLRLTIDAPGDNRPVWEFHTIADGETVTIAHDADHPVASSCCPSSPASRCRVRRRPRAGRCAANRAGHGSRPTNGG